MPLSKLLGKGGESAFDSFYSIMSFDVNGTKVKISPLQVADQNLRFLINPSTPTPPGSG
jgi:hypothetical protein